MAPKKKKDNDEEAAREAAKWQAVVCTDWLGDGFGALSTSRALLTVCGTPLIELWLSQLLAAGCAEVFVLTGQTAHATALQAAADAWKKRVFIGKMRVSVIELPGCGSIGDALRDVNMPALTGDFVLVQGTALIDLDLKELLKQHRSAREKEPDVVLTKVFCRSDADTAAPWERLSIIYEQDSKELVTCVTAEDKLKLGDHAQNYLLKARKDCELACRFDRVDACYSICDIEIVQKIKDEPDMQDPTADLVSSILTAKFQDLFSSHSIQVVEHSGAVLHVHDARSFHATCLHILRLLRGKTAVKLFGDAFAGDASKQVLPNNVFAYAPLPEGVEASDVFIGRGVTLAAGCTVKRCILLDGASIGPECEVEESLIGTGAAVPEGANCYQCVVHGALEPGDHLSEHIGPLGVEHYAAGEKASKQVGLIGADAAALWSEVSEQRAAAREGEKEEDDEGTDIHKEVAGILANAESRLKNTGDMDRPGVIVELRSLRMAFDLTPLDFICVLCPKLMDRVLCAAKAGQKLKPVIERWLPLLGAFRVKNSIKEGVRVVELIERICRENQEKLDPAKFAMICCAMSDVLDELDDDEESDHRPFKDAVLEWYKSAASKLSALQTFIAHDQVKKMVDYLQQSDDSSNESD